MKLKAWVAAAALGAGLFAVAPSASAETVSVGFELITSSRSNLDDLAESQFRVDISNTSNANQALFTFLNIGDVASSICDIYFDDGSPATLLGIAQIINYDGVNFAGGAAPEDLPGGNNADPDFTVTQGFFAADSEAPTQPNGVNPGERVDILVNLLNGMTFNDVKDALTRPFAGGLAPLRIGIHVQGFSDDISASYVSTPPTGTPPPPAVPLPATVWAGLALLGGVGAKRLRQRQAVQA